nr:timeless-like protein 1 [Sinonovacula constricta]
MEWHVMNGMGLNGSLSDFGSVIDGVYQTAPDCCENLGLVLEHLLDDDPVQRPIRRQLASSHAVEQELVPLLTGLKDDPSVFSLAVRLCVNLTQPVECLQLGGGGGGGGDTGSNTAVWCYDVQKLLTDAKKAFTNIKCIESIFSEIQKILENAGEYDLVPEDCDMINHCLLLVRNLLHIQDNQQASLSDTHILFLKYLFQAGIDEVMMSILNSKQKEYWGVTVVQLISLLYKDLVSEIFMMFEDVSSCSEESCDSSNCSQCEAAMDRCLMEPGFSSSETKPTSPPCSKCSSLISFSQKDDATITQSCFEDGSTNMPQPQSCPLVDKPSQCSHSTLCSSFKSNCQMRMNSFAEPFPDYSQNGSSEEEGKEPRPEGESGNLSNSTSEGSLRAVSSTSDTSTARSDHLISIEELGSRLADFTTHFLQNGFSSLVHVLKLTLVHNSINPPLDDSYFLWSVAFFLKFARRKEIEFKKIKEVFTTDVFGFLVYEAVINSEEVINQYNNNKTASLSMRRLHLSVSALRELLKTLTFHKEKGLGREDTAYLNQLQRDLANMSDLRQLFLWLIRSYTPGCHSNLFLRDVIVTNHYFLLLLEEWISKQMSDNTSLTMLSHVKQFASSHVMKQYGRLLQNFVKNDHHVNNCVFTMMHHVAGDCAHPETLLQVGILKTFLQIWDAEIPITQEMNDLMEYVIHKFFKLAEDNPVSCAVQLFNGAQDEDVLFNEETDTVTDTEWTEEEEDKLIMWYSKLSHSPNMVNKLVKKFADNGMKKSKLEIVNQLYQLGMLSSDELTDFLKDKDLASLKLETDEKSSKEETSERENILIELSEMKEDHFLANCLQNIKAEGLRDQLKFLQKSLLEAAFAKIDEGYMKKEQVEEPVAKYFHRKGKPIPVVFFNESQEKIRDSIYMLALMQYLGLTWDEDCPWIYPKIPCEFTSHDLVVKAKILGDIDEDIKFDPHAIPVEDTTTSIKEKTNLPESCHKDMSRSRPLEKLIPAVGWMNMVHQFNIATSHNSGAVTLLGGSVCKGRNGTMDLE